MPPQVPNDPPKDASVARLPKDAPPKSLSGTLELTPVGYLSVQLLFLGEPVKDLQVEFFAVDPATGAEADAVKDPNAPDADQTQKTNDNGKASLSFLLPIGNYICEIEKQELNGQKLQPLVTTVESVDKPFILTLPIGRPYFDLPSTLAAASSGSGSLLGSLGDALSSAAPSLPSTPSL